MLSHIPEYFYINTESVISVIWNRLSSHSVVRIWDMFWVSPLCICPPESTDYLLLNQMEEILIHHFFNDFPQFIIVWIIGIDL